MIKSLKFPNIFSNASTNTISGKAATAQNIILTLHTQKKSFFGDPYFGSSNIKRMIFEQNNNVLRDLMIDDIHSTLATFIPQIKLDRKDIEITSDGAVLYANIKCKNLIDFKMEEINIALFNLEELE